MLVCLEEKIYWLIYRIILYLKKQKNKTVLFTNDDDTDI